MSRTFAAAIAFGLLVCAIGARASAQIALTPGTLDPNGVLRFDYPSPSTPALICAPQLTCVLQLQPGERIENIGSADTVKRIPDGWLIVPGHQGETPLVYFTPQSAKNVGNVVITTQRRIYGLYLVAAPLTAHWKYGFRYAQGQDDRSAHQDREPNNPALPVGSSRRAIRSRPSLATPAALPMPATSPMPGIATLAAQSPPPRPNPNTNYFISGDPAPFRPIAIEQDDGVMYVTLPPGQYEWPAVKAVIGNTIEPVPETPDNTPLRARRLIIQGVYNVLILWTNDGGTERDVYVSYGAPYSPSRGH